MTGIDVPTNAALFDADFVTDDGILFDSARDGRPSCDGGASTLRHRDQQEREPARELVAQFHAAIANYD